MSILDGIKGDGDVQKEKDLSVKRDAREESLDALMLAYQGVLERVVKLEAGDNYGIAYQELKGVAVDPRMIDEFCLRIKNYQDENLFGESGLFISAMLQNAYDSGHNDFHINTQHLEIDIGGIGAYICGKGGNPISVTINGDAGGYCGYRAEHSCITFMGDAGEFCGDYAKHSRFTFMGDAVMNCGSSAEHSHFTFMGDAGRYSGFQAESSTFIFNADAGEQCGALAKRSHFTFNGDAGEGCGLYAGHSDFTFNGDAGRCCGAGAENSVFYSPRREVLKDIKKLGYTKFRKIWVRPNHTCRLYLINPDGTSEPYGPVTKIRDFISGRSR